MVRFIGMVGHPRRNFMEMASWSRALEHLVNLIGMSDQLKWNNHSSIPSNLIIVIFYYQIPLKPLKTLSLSQVSFPLLFPLCYIVLSVFTNSHKGKYKGKKNL